MIYTVDRLSYTFSYLWDSDSKSLWLYNCWALSSNGDVFGIHRCKANTEGLK